MNNNPNQPKEYDAVLGGQTPPPVQGAVLGGIEGVKHRVKSTVPRDRAAALIEALRYGEEGLDLLIQALKDPSEQVQLFSSRLLLEKGGEKEKLAVLKHNPWVVFTRLEDWKAEDFAPAVGIIYPIGTVYHVNLYYLNQSSYGYYQYGENFTLEQFELLLQEPRVVAIEALACWFSEVELYSEKWETFLKALCKASKRLSSLKALYIGDRREHEYQKSRLYMTGICEVLEAFPQLEVLKLHGNPYGLFLKKQVRHDCLKTFIIETAGNNYDPIAKICALELPALEYLELWGGSCCYTSDRVIDSLQPLLTGKSFPNLCYLGLPSFEGTDRLAEAIAHSAILHRLAVLDLSRGTLTDKGAKVLLKCWAINRLHTLNVSMNNLSTSMIQKLAKLNCKVIAQPQDDEGSYRYNALYE